MDILITGAAGFVGKNLTAALECIRDGKDRTHPGLEIGRIYCYDIDSSPELLEEACRKSNVICSGVNTYEGKLTCKNVALAHDYEYTDLKELIG